MCQRCGNPWKVNTYLKEIKSVKLAIGDDIVENNTMEKMEPREIKHVREKKKYGDVKGDSSEENCNFQHGEKIDELETSNNNKEDSIKKLKEVIESLYIKLNEKEDSINRLKEVIESLFIKLDEKEDIIEKLGVTNESSKVIQIEGDSVIKPLTELQSASKNRNISIERSPKRKASVEDESEFVSPTKFMKISQVPEKEENGNSVIDEQSSTNDEKREKSNSDTEVIYWDLETTGLNKDQKHVDIEIVEIGAISSSTGEKFKQYLLPTTPITLNASTAHGIYLKHKGGGYDMSSLYVQDTLGKMVKVDAVDKKTGLKMFLDWLRKFNKKIVLAGYNNHRFDDWVLSHNLLHADLDASGLGIRFGDVAKIVRPVLRRDFNSEKWSLTFAVKCLLGRGQAEAHGAISDTEDVRDLLRKIAEDQRASTKEILEKTVGEKDDERRAIKDIDEVMKVCVKMFLSSGLYLVGSGRKPVGDQS